MRQVHEQLWIGDIADARTEPLSEYGISAVITTCQDSVEDNVGCDYFHFNMADGPHTGYGGDWSYAMFEQAANRVLLELQKGRTVLVHCHAGISRSVSVSAAALSVYTGQSIDIWLERCRKSQQTSMGPEGILVEHAERYADSLLL